MYLPNSNAVIIIMYLCGAVGMDIWKRKIPNAYIIIGFLFLLSVQDIRVICCEIVLVGICTIPLYIFGVLGAGDIKFLCVLSGYFSAKLVVDILIYALIITALAGGIVKVGFLIQKKEESIHKFPFTISILCSLISHIWR